MYPPKYRNNLPMLFSIARLCASPLFFFLFCIQVFEVPQVPHQFFLCSTLTLTCFDIDAFIQDCVSMTVQFSFLLYLNDEARRTVTLLMLQLSDGDENSSEHHKLIFL